MTEWIITSIVMIAAVIALRQIFKGRISMRMRYGLWALVLLRLLIPGNFIQSNLSVENLTGAISERPQIQAITQELSAPQQSYESIYQEVVQEHYQSYYPESTVPATLPATELVQIQQEVQLRVEQSAPIYSLRQILLGIWILGMAIVGSFLLAINWDFSRRLKLTREAVEANVPIPVYKSFMAETPCLFGLLHPVIYITEETAADPKTLAHILAHETTHYRHRDHIWAFLRSICLVLHWYNPLVWVAVSLSKRDCELACDEATIAHIGEENRIEYGKTLIGITCIKRAPSAVLLTATTMLSDKKTLTERIRMVAKKPKVVISAVVAAVIIAAVAVGCTFTGAPEESTETTEPTETTEATTPTETTETTAPVETTLPTEPTETAYPYANDPFVIPDAPEAATVQGLPLYYSPDSLVTPYWEQGVSFDGQADFISIPSVYPFSQDAVDCQAEIYNDLLPTLQLYQETAGYKDTQLLPMSKKENVDYLAGIDYAAYEYKDILSIVVRIMDHYDGIVYFVYNLDLDTGKRMSNEDVLSRMGIHSVDLKSLLEAEYISRWSDPAEPEKYYTQQREKTTSSENIAASQIYVTSDGTVMVAARIYSLAGADSYMYLLTLHSPANNTGRAAIKDKNADWNYQPSSTAEDTARSIVSHYDGVGKILRVEYDEEMTQANISLGLASSEEMQRYDLTEEYLQNHFKCIVVTYLYTDPSGNSATYINKLWLMQDEEDGLWYLWGSLTPYEDDSAAQFPDAPARGSVQALPENAQLSDLVVPYWELGAQFAPNGDTYYVFIPEIYPFSQEAIDCQAQIYELFADALKSRLDYLNSTYFVTKYLDTADVTPEVGKTSGGTFYYGYTASYQDGLLSIVVIIDNIASGQETYYTFNLNVPGQASTGAQPSREAIRAALEAEFKKMYANVDSSLDFYQENLKKTLSDENIGACVLSYAEDGTPQVTAWIYTVGSVDKVQKVISLHTPTLLGLMNIKEEDVLQLLEMHYKDTYRDYSESAMKQGLDKTVSQENLTDSSLVDMNDYLSLYVTIYPPDGSESYQIYLGIGYLAS